MSTKIERDEDGQFAKGQSGNPDGARLRKPKDLLTIDDLNLMHLKVANETVATRDGKPVTRYEQCLRSLASNEAANRLGKRDFVELTQSAAYHFRRKERQAATKGGRP